MAIPPVTEGAAQESDTWLVPPEAVKPLGADGADAEVIGPTGTEKVPTPAEVIAATRNEYPSESAEVRMLEITKVVAVVPVSEMRVLQAWLIAAEPDGGR